MAAEERTPAHETIVQNGKAPGAVPYGGMLEVLAPRVRDARVPKPLAVEQDEANQVKKTPEPDAAHAEQPAESAKPPPSDPDQPSPAASAVRKEQSPPEEPTEPTDQQAAKKPTAKQPATARKTPASRTTAGAAKQPKAAPKKPTVKKATTKQATAKNSTAKKAGAGTRRSDAASQALDATVAMAPLRLPNPTAVERTWLRSYPPGVPETYEYPLVPLTRFLDDAAQDFPHTPAITFLGLELTYRTLLEQVDRLAAALQSMGLGRGDRIGLLLPNCPQHVIAMFAALRIGATVVEAEAHSDASEFGQQFAETGVSVIVFLDPLYEQIQRVKDRLPTVRHLIGTGIQDYLPLHRSLLFPITGRRDGSYARIPSSERVLRLSELIKRSAPVFVQVEIEPAHDVAAILYTRGSTGERRGVMLSHLNLVANAFQGRLWIPDIQAGRERILCAVPFSQAFGLTACLMVGMLSACTLVLVPDFDRDGVIRTIAEQRPTLFPALPSMYADIVESPLAARYDLSSLRACLAGGGPLPVRIAERFEQLTGGKLRESYGLVEAGPLTHANPMYGRAKPGSIGLPVTDTVCALVDRNDPLRLARPGEAGELAIHGPQVMKGYWNRASETVAVLRNGWLFTGDIVEVDEEGYFRVVDQKRDVIKADERDVVPRDVETVLIRHPKVKTAAVAGIPNFPRGEMVKAYIVLRQGETASTDEIDAYCRRELAAYQVPQRYEFRAFLPQAPPGKALREALVAEELAQLGLHK